MLRKDASARFERRGLFSNKYVFVYAKRESTALRKTEYEAIIDGQQYDPVLLVDDGEVGRKWWLFQGVFYWEDEGLIEREVKALILSRHRKDRNRVELAVAAMDGQTTARERISSAVQTMVWNRDGGKCVKCGSQHRLEFDHIIPLAKGGSNSARNLQLLCERCNRSKGVQIG